MCLHTGSLWYDSSLTSPFTPIHFPCLRLYDRLFPPRRSCRPNPPSCRPDPPSAITAYSSAAPCVIGLPLTLMRLCSGLHRPPLTVLTYSLAQLVSNTVCLLYASMIGSSHDPMHVFLAIGRSLCSLPSLTYVTRLLPMLPLRYWLGLLSTLPIPLPSALCCLLTMLFVSRLSRLGSLATSMLA